MQGKKKNENLNERYQTKRNVIIMVNEMYDNNSITTV